MQSDSPAAPAQAVELDPLALLFHASGPVLLVNWLLIAAAAAVWTVGVLKLLQLGRMRAAERSFELEAEKAVRADQLVAIAKRHPAAPGGHVVLSIAGRAAQSDLAAPEAQRALVDEEQRAGELLGVLSTVGATGPFIGLFGTVWGILDAFLRIGREKSASLAVVAPAIGEALISTAAGLFAAIPAVIAYNLASKRADDLLSRVEAASEAWVALLRRRPEAEPARAAAVDASAPPGGTRGDVQWARP